MIAKQVGPLEMGRTAAFFIILAIAALGLALTVSSGAVNASVPNQGGPLHVFLGSAIINGNPAPEGTVVAALIDGVTVSTVEVDASGRYVNLQVSTAGAAVTFTIGGLPAAETATSERGGLGILNLTAIGAAQPVDTPVPPTAAPAPSAGRYPRSAYSARAGRYPRSAHCGSRAGRYPCSAHCACAGRYPCSAHCACAGRYPRSTHCGSRTCGYPRSAHCGSRACRYPRSGHCGSGPCGYPRSTYCGSRACEYSRSAHCGSRAGTTRGLQRQLRLEPGPKLLQWRRRHGIIDPAPTGTGGLGRTAPEASRLLDVGKMYLSVSGKRG